MCEAKYAKLLAPVLACLTVSAVVREVHLFRHLFIDYRECKDAAFRVESGRERDLASAMTPLDSVVSFRAAFYLVVAVQFRRLALSARHFLAVLVHVVWIE